ncbi:Hint domain-containing protein [Amycolatopsis sp. WGS_07]|uniref:Hint domain-containing protein n=1 Tax=Amycolatopsis sp. WGS_07 TaxID=3076764 RepID=UPI0038738066
MDDVVKDESKAAEGAIALGISCPIAHSFTGDTPVLLADGSTKPISEIKVGDIVADSDPTTGHAQQHPVTAVHVTSGDRDRVELDLADADGRPLRTTEHHQIWEAQTKHWVEAGQLQPGDRVSVPGGTATIRRVARYQDSGLTYDLTIDGLHTYYVLAGLEPVLVHNTGCFSLTDLGGGKLQTPEGLVYGPMKGGEGHRIFHVGAHASESANPNKLNHSIFTGQQSPLELVDEAWARRGAAEPGDPGAYVVPMGRSIGSGGETSIRVVVKPGTTEVITAYPY